MSEKPNNIRKKGKLFGNFLLKKVELCLSIGAIAEQSRTDALPIAASHGEDLASRQEVLAIETIEELVEVLLIVVGHSKPYFLETAFHDELALATSLYADALFRQTDASEELARAEETSKAVACGIDQRGALALIANHLLREHIPAGFQTVGRQGTEREPPFAVAEIPVGIDGIVVPLPLQSEGTREVIIGLRQKGFIRWNGQFHSSTGSPIPLPSRSTPISGQLSCQRAGWR